MNTTFKIQKLWQYLGIQDDEILIVRRYHSSKGNDEFLIVESNHGELKISTTPNMPELRVDRPFHLIQQLDSAGKYIIPSVNQLIQDEVSDY